jgi:hypothetical protein
MSKILKIIKKSAYIRHEIHVTGTKGLQALSRTLTVLQARSLSSPTACILKSYTYYCNIKRKFPLRVQESLTSFTRG